MPAPLLVAYLRADLSKRGHLQISSGADGTGTTVEIELPRPWMRWPSSRLFYRFHP